MCDGNPYSSDDGANCILWNICSKEPINGNFYTFGKEISTESGF